MFPPQPRSTTLTGPLLRRAKYISRFSFIPMVPKSNVDSEGDEGKYCNFVKNKFLVMPYEQPILTCSNFPSKQSNGICTLVRFVCSVR